MSGYPFTVEKEMQASALKSADGQTSAVNVENYLEGLILIDVTASGGDDEEMQCIVETALNLTDNKWAFLTSIDPITGIGFFAKQLTVFGKYIRVSFTLGGTSPTFTFSVKFLGKASR